MMKVWSPGFHMKIVLSYKVTAYVSSGNLLTFSNIASKVHRIVGNGRGDAQLLHFSFIQKFHHVGFFLGLVIEYLFV